MAAGNEWINGYLEAILDAGVRPRGGAATGAGPLALTLDAAAYSPTRYFVEEVVSRFDDRDLHKTWTKVVAMRSSQERNNRLENLCWRIWHVARKKKQVEWEYSRQVERRRLEQDLGAGRPPRSSPRARRSNGLTAPSSPLRGSAWRPHRLRRRGRCDQGRQEPLHRPHQHTWARPWG